MDIMKLKYFQTLAQLESMTKASKVLNISQPALSKAIKNLEDSLEIKLFNRHQNKMELNKFGKVLLEYTNRAFFELDGGKKIIKEMAGLEKGEITVAATFPHFFPVLLINYLKKFPNINIKQFQASSENMKRLILDNKIDFGISTTPITTHDIKWIPLLDEEIFLTFPSNHHLSEQNIVSLSTVKYERFVGLLPGYGFRDITDEFCQQAGVKPNYTLEMEESGAIFKLVREGYGVAFAPETSFFSPHPGVVPISIKYPEFKRTIGVAFKKNHYFSEATENFFQFIIDTIKTIRGN